MKNRVQLITYINRLTGGGIPELAALLNGPLAGVFGGVHLLPFFIQSTDRTRASIPSTTPPSISGWAHGKISARWDRPLS